jgi:flagella synthesis protein FlgN
MTATTPLTALREEHRIMGLLLDLMQQEQQFLVAAEVEQLNGVMEQKNSLVAQMTRLSAQRHQALAAAGFPGREEGMAGWVAASGDASATELWHAVLDLTRQAKELNRLNGMLINKHLVHSQGALNAMRPTPAGGNFYGPSGQTVNNPAKRRYVIG